MQSSTIGKEQCAEKLNQMKKYLPFIDFMINKIKKKSDTLPLETQLNKFKLLRSMIAERKEKHNWNVILRVEDVIEQLVVKLNYQDQNRTVSGESTGCGETEGNESPVRDTSENNEVEVTSPICIPPSSTATLVSVLNTSPATADDSNNQAVGATNKGDALRNSFNTSGDEIGEMANSRKETWSLIQKSSSKTDTNRRTATNSDKDLDGYVLMGRSNSNRNTRSFSTGVPEETTPHTDSLSSSRGMLVQSHPSTSQQTFSQSLKSHTNVSNRSQAPSRSYSGYVTYKNPSYRSHYLERRTIYDRLKVPQLCDRSGEKHERNKRHSREKYETPIKDSRRDRTVSPSESLSSRTSDFQSRARRSDRSPSDSYKSHRSSKDFRGPTKDSGSKINDESEMVEVASHRSSKSTDKSEREKSRMSLTGEKNKRDSTCGEKSDLFESRTRKRKSNDEKPVDHGKRKKIHITSLNDKELEEFVKENIQALPHLATLKPSEIREAIKRLGIETFEGPSSSSSENDLQDLDEFMNDSPAESENLDSRISGTKSSDLNAQNKIGEKKHLTEEEHNIKNISPVVEASENVNVSEGDGDILTVTRDDKVLVESDFTIDTFDEFNPKMQSPKKKGLLELPLPETDELYDDAPHMETARLSMPSEESNVNKKDQVGPSENVKNPVPVARRHSLNSTTVQSTSSYRTKDIVYGTWLASALPSHVTPLQGSIPMTQPNILLDPRLAMASSSQSYHGMLSPMGNINVSQMVANPRFQQPSLFSPPLVNTGGPDGKISNPSHSSEAKSYAEYRRLKNEEMRKLQQKSPSSNVTPKTSSESNVGGGLADDKNVPKKTQAIRSPQYRRCGGKTTTSTTQRRHSDYSDSRARLRENPNGRARKDEDRRKKTSIDSEETISPLDSLYGSESKPQTGRGYGLQHFKIPKKVRSNTSGDKNTKFLTENKRQSSKIEEDWVHPEESTNTNKHDGSSSRKEEESRDSTEQTTNKSRNNKDVSRKGEEDRTSPERTTNRNKNDKDTSCIGRGNRDSLQQTTGRSQGERKMSRKEGKNHDIPEQTKDSNKDGTKVMHNVEENRDCRDETANKKENVSKVEGKTDSREAIANTTEDKNTDGTDGNFLYRETTADTEENVNRHLEFRAVTEYTREDSNNTDRKFDSRETTPDSEENVGRNLESREATENTREDDGNTDGNFLSCETTTNTTDRDGDRNSNMISSMPGHSNSREATANTTGGKDTNGTDGNFPCRETNVNTKEDNNNEVNNAERGGLEEEIETNDEEENEFGPELIEPQELENSDDEEGIEQEESSNAGSNDVETNKEKEHLVMDCDSSIHTLVSETSNPSQDNQELTNTTPAAHEGTKEWVETFVRQSLDSKSVKIAKVLEKIGQLSKKKLKTIEKIIDKESDSSSSSENEDEEIREEIREESSESADGRAENNNVEVNQSEKIPEDENQKSPFKANVDKDGTEGEATEKDESEVEATEKETEVNIETGDDGLGESVASTSHEEEPKQSELSVTNTQRGSKTRRSRGRRRRVGLDFVTRKRNRKTPQKQRQKQLLEEPMSEAAQLAGTDTGNLKSGEAQEPKARKKPKGKSKTELDRLHDDIRSMFIGADVVAATGQRSCRILKECANNTNNSDIIRESARPVEEQLKRGSTRGSSRNTSRRNTNSNDGSPSDTGADEINPGPVVEEYHKSTQWPRIVMQKIDLENFGYGQKISDTCVTFSRQTGDNKAIRSERNWRSESSASLIDDEKVPRNIGSERPTNNSTKKGSKGKKKTEKKSPPAERAQTHQETCERSEGERPRSTTPTHMSPVGESNEEREGMVECPEDESLLDYAFERRIQEYECKLCSFVSEEITDHYKTNHKWSEVLISRLNRTEAADALREAAENDFEDNLLEDTPLDMVRDMLLSTSGASSDYYCRMCDMPRMSNLRSFYVHVCEHTGEDKYRCPLKGCKLSLRNRVDMRVHIYLEHYVRKFLNYRSLLKHCLLPAKSGYLFGYICSRCHYVQIHRENLESHMEQKHRGDINTEIIKINMSSRIPPGENKSNITLLTGVQRTANDMELTEREDPDEDIMEDTGHEDADEMPENRHRLENRRQNPNQRWVEFMRFREECGSDDEHVSEPFVNTGLAAKIEVDESVSYLFKPETDLEANSEANLETNFEENLEAHFEGDSEQDLETQVEANPEPNSQRPQETRLEANSEPNLEKQPDTNLVAHLESDIEEDDVDLDECADLGKFTSIRGSDIIDPLESSDSMGANSENTDSRGADSPFTPVPSTSTARPDTEAFFVPPLEPTLEPTVEPTVERTVQPALEPTSEPTLEPDLENTEEVDYESTEESEPDTLKVGPLQAHLLDDIHIVYECFIKGCLFNTRSYIIFEKHLKICHSNTKWNGHCQVCRANVKAQRRKHWPTVTFALSSALKHLKVHAKHEVCKRTGMSKSSATPDGCVNRILNVVNEREHQDSESENIETESECTDSESQRAESDNLYPRRPLLRVRNFLGDRLSRTTQQDSVVREEPAAKRHTEENTNESLMFTIQDVRSLNPEVGSGSGIQFEEVVSPANSVRDQAKAKTGQPVIVRSCPTRQIAIRPDTNVLPIEVGHLQVVQAPASSSPLSDSTSVDNESVITGTLPDPSSVRIGSSASSQSQAPRIPFQPVMISTPPPIRPPTQIVSPIATPSTSSQAVAPSSLVMQPEPQPSTSSSGPIATVELPTGQSAVESAKIGNRRTSMPRKRTVTRVGKGSALPSRPENLSEEESSLQKMRSVLPFGNKTIKDSEIYESMLTKKKICQLFKCMASDCSFTCNDQTMFEQHIELHEANKKDKKAMFSRKRTKMFTWQQCCYCCEIIPTPSGLSQHILNVHGHCVYQCAYCFYRAVSLNYIIIHEDLAHEDTSDTHRKMYKCRKLSIEPVSQAYMERQTRKQCVRPYICVQCGNKFLITQEFSDHLVTEHQSVTAYTCHICKNLCFKADRLVAHYRLHSYSTYQCCYCLHGTELEWEMVLHLCNFHFTQPLCVYMRAWTERTGVMRHEAHLDYLKLLTYEDVVTPGFILEPDSELEDSENEDSQEVNAIAAELGIRTEGEYSGSIPIIKEIVSLAKSPQDVPVTSLLPNARFSSEGESGSETVLISSGLSTAYRRESSAPKRVENINRNVPMGQVPLETVTSQPMIARYGVSSGGTMARSRTVVKHMGRSQAKTSSSNLLQSESANITPNVTALPPATHKLPPVLTQRTATNIRLPEKRVSRVNLRKRQAEEEPAASSSDIGEAEVSCDQQQAMVDPVKQELNISIESTNVQSNTETMEGSTDESSQEETQDSTPEMRNENDETQDSEEGEFNRESRRGTTSPNSNENVINPLPESQSEISEDLGTSAVEEASTSTSLPRTRYSALRPKHRKDDPAARRSSSCKSGDKNFIKDLTGEDLYKCGNRGCDFAAPDERELRNHLLVCDHSRNFPLLTCEHCSRLFKLNDHYLCHLKLHGVKKLTCGLCSYKATLESTMVRHVKQKHRCKQFKTLPTEPPKEGYLVYYPKNYKKEKQNFMVDGYAPGDEDKLPLQAVYQVNVKCAKCPYFTKVRSNMVRHLKIHVKSAETEGLVVPSTAPTNPVPCLDAKEKMFDKMTNLAASSQLAQAKERTTIEILTPEEIAKMPQYVNEHMRYKCCLPDCNYITVDDGMLKHHIKALHTEVTYYSCPHCKSTVHADIRHVALDKIGFHLRHHNAKLYKCAHCIYFHYQKVVVERHTLEKHPDRKYFVHTVREPRSEEESSSAESSTTVYKCALCKDFQNPSRSAVLDHLSKSHGTKSLYKCQFCDMKSNHYQSFTSHFAAKHPEENISYFSTIIRDTCSNPESTAVSESTSDHFDTTPLWQRGASRVRHIRGILIEDTEEIRKKKGKKTVEHTESTSARATTSPPAPPPTTAPPARPRSRPPPRSRGSTPVPAPALVQTSTPAPAPPPALPKTLTPVSTLTLAPASAVPVRASSQIRAPTKPTVQASAPILTPAPALARAPSSVPTITMIPTLTPAPRRVWTLSPSGSATMTTVRASPPLLTPAPAPILTSAGVRVPSWVRPPVTTTVSASASVSTPATAPAPTPTPVPIRLRNPALAQALASAPVPAPARARARPRLLPGAPTSTSENSSLQRGSGGEPSTRRQNLEERQPRSRLNRESLPNEEREMVFWVNSIIEQQRLEIERKRQLSESEETRSSRDSPTSSKRRKRRSDRTSQR